MNTAYDCRKDAPPGSLRFPCNVVILDPATGDRIPNVFRVETSPAKVSRFVADASGQPMVNPATRRAVSFTDPATGKSRRRVDHDRLELHEVRPWVAVAKDGGGVVARSEGAG